MCCPLSVRHLSSRDLCLATGNVPCYWQQRSSFFWLRDFDKQVPGDSSEMGSCLFGARVCAHTVPEDQHIPCLHRGPPSAHSPCHVQDSVMPRQNILMQGDVSVIWVFEAWDLVIYFYPIYISLCICSSTHLGSKEREFLEKWICPKSSHRASRVSVQREGATQAGAKATSSARLWLPKWAAHQASSTHPLYPSTVQSIHQSSQNYLFKMQVGLCYFPS
jgi:hypothetical protein